MKKAAKSKRSANGRRTKPAPEMLASAQYRQGDVFVRPTRSTLEQMAAAKPIPLEHGVIVLAHGEATGHMHAISPAGARLVELQLTPGVVQRILRVEAPKVRLYHDEHTEIWIPRGDYDVVRQREYSPEAIRNVAD